MSVPARGPIQSLVAARRSLRRKEFDFPIPSEGLDTVQVMLKRDQPGRESDTPWTKIVLPMIALEGLLVSWQWFSSNGMVKQNDRLSI